MSGPLAGPGRPATMAPLKVRLRFAKRGDLRLVSHHDLMRCLERMARRAGLPLAQSQGFNPRPKIAFTLALALGIEGHHEVVEIELAGPMEPTEVLHRLAAAARRRLGRSVTPCPSPPTAARTPAPPWPTSWPGIAGPTPGTGPTAPSRSTCGPSCSTRISHPRGSSDSA